MQHRYARPAALAVLASLLLGFFPAFAVEIDPALQRALAAKQGAGFYRVLMFYDHPAEAWRFAPELKGLTGTEQRRALLSRLKEHNGRMQASALAVLQDPAYASGVREVRQLYLAGAIAGELDARVIGALADLSAEAVLCLDLPGGHDAERPAGQVAAAAPTAPAPTDTVWSVKYILADRVWIQLGYTGQDVVVGHLDTGVYLTHPDLQNRLWQNPGEIPGNGIDDDGNGFVDDVAGWDFGDQDNDPNDDSNDPGHGTHTAGTVAGDGTGGTLTGVAPGARIMVCKVFNYAGGNFNSWTLAGQQYCAENGARIITMSLGAEGDLPASYMRNDRINNDNLRALGLTIFNSAGNEHLIYDPPNELGLTARSPAPWVAPGVSFSHTSGVIAVGSTGYQSTVVYLFSSRGPADWGDVDPWFDWPYDPGAGLIKPDVAAPGVNVNSLVIPSGYSGDTWSGTSMACPHVAGVAALMLEKNPSLSPAGLDSLLELTAVDLGDPGKDNVFGAGLVNAWAAVQATPLAQHPYLVLEEVLPDDAGDQALSVGETSEIAFRLANRSTSVQAAGISLQLAVAANPHVSVVDGAAGLADLPVGASGDNLADPFLLEVASGTPEGYEFTLLLTISCDGGYERTFDIPWSAGLPEWRTHDVGDVYLTVTDQGILGYMIAQSDQGEGMGWLDGPSELFVGSLWAGTSEAYVCNRDYPGDLEVEEWEVTLDPTGRVAVKESLLADQVFEAAFNDAGHASPREVTVRLTSMANAADDLNDFIILEYTFTNNGVENLSPYYAGVFCDFDIDDSGANEGGTDPGRSLVYLYADGGPYYGIVLLGGSTPTNLSLLSNPVYVYPLLQVPDADKFQHLTGELSLASTPSADDYSAIAATSFDLPADGTTRTVAFALVRGATLAELQVHADKAAITYTPTSDETLPAAPPVLALEQNRPNPFNPSTEIRFQLSRATNVDLAVFDLSGRRVKSLLGGLLPTGPHVARWDGTDEHGLALPSGLYFCRLIAEGRTMTKKMTLLR